MVFMNVNERLCFQRIRKSEAMGLIIEKTSRERSEIIKYDEVMKHPIANYFHN